MGRPDGRAHDAQRQTDLHLSLQGLAGGSAPVEIVLGDTVVRVPVARTCNMCVVVRTPLPTLCSVSGGSQAGWRGATRHPAVASGQLRYR